MSCRVRDGANLPDGRRIGLLAQEVQNQFPELVMEDPHGMLSVAYGNFSAVLLGAVEEQDAVIKKREKTIVDLESRLAAIEQKIGAARAR